MIRKSVVNRSTSMHHLWAAGVIVPRSNGESGNTGACIVGREHRLSPEALAEELTSVSRRTLTKKAAPRSSNVIDELKRELRMIGK